MMQIEGCPPKRTMAETSFAPAKGASRLKENERLFDDLKHAEVMSDPHWGVDQEHRTAPGMVVKGSSFHVHLVKVADALQVVAVQGPSPLIS